MPVDPRISAYIKDQLLNGDFDIQLEVVITDIVSLLGTAPADARHTSAYLIYFLSSHRMRSDNEVEQAAHAIQMTILLRRLYNDALFIMHLRAGTRTEAYAVVLNIYRVHYAFTLNGLRSAQGPMTLDYGDPLRMLQIIIGAAYGPWSVHIRLMGAIRDYHRSRIRFYAGTPYIELGRSPAPTNQRFRISTWNMQGTSQTSNSKWRTKILQLARANDVVLIQEAGVNPFSSRLISHLTVHDQFGVTHIVDQLLWEAGTASRPENYHLYYLDVQRLRVNLAIVVAASTDIDVRNVVVLSDGLPDDSGAPINRPALGVQICRSHQVPSSSTALTTAFNFHAISGGGVNAPRMLREISCHTETPYVLAGDFNRDPRAIHSAYPARRGNWISPPEIAQLVMANGSTHPSTAPQNMLDYAITNGTSGPTQSGHVDTLGPSDHLAVSYEFTFPQ
ncbi:endonuclease/exonuclease/phosphatase family protein [Pseudomonas syringae]|uniref:endonuclease/exonuclease/phosphatase family protein n=1 Tax=Pseudomonas syringae TaxID=317 RepID=UPI000417BA41|nr:endonuclease/exonuclease/phosphatase family protein [Pseudomonas syringae]